MGIWYLSLAGSLVLVMIGLYTHWLITLVGALLPFLPLFSYLARRRKPPSD